MSVTLKVILIVLSFISFFLCIKKIKKSQLKMETSIIWMVGSVVLILMSIFSNAVEWLSNLLGFIAPVNFVFFTIIVFLLVEVFIDGIRISQLNEKIKDLNHYIALEESKKNTKGDKNE